MENVITLEVYRRANNWDLLIYLLVIHTTSQMGALLSQTKVHSETLTATKPDHREEQGGGGLVDWG